MIYTNYILHRKGLAQFPPDENNWKRFTHLTMQKRNNPNLRWITENAVGNIVITEKLCPA